MVVPGVSAGMFIGLNGGPILVLMKEAFCHLTEMKHFTGNEITPNWDFTARLEFSDKGWVNK